MALVEAVANLVVGYAPAIWVQLLVFPMFGLEARLRQSLGIGSRRCGSIRLAGRSSETLRQSAISRDLPTAEPAVRHRQPI
jgi:hypothetical protein